MQTCTYVPWLLCSGAAVPDTSSPDDFESGLPCSVLLWAAPFLSAAHCISSLFVSEEPAQKSHKSYHRKFVRNFCLQAIKCVW